MSALWNTRIAAVWGLLIAATLMSWWLGTDHGVDDPRVAGVGILLVAFAKVRLVGLHFMELRDAPLPLRVIFESWCVAVCSAVIGMYLLG